MDAPHPVSNTLNEAIAKAGVTLFNSSLTTAVWGWIRHGLILVNGQGPWHGRCKSIARFHLFFSRHARHSRQGGPHSRYYILLCGRHACV